MSMYVTAVHVSVKPDRVEDFIAASRENCRHSSLENGNRRFDLLQSADDPTRFLLYEAYDSAGSAAAHKETAHYRAWRDAVADMMAAPRQGIVYQGLSD